MHGMLSPAILTSHIPKSYSSPTPKPILYLCQGPPQSLKLTETSSWCEPQSIGTNDPALTIYYFMGRGESYTLSMPLLPNYTINFL